MVEEKKDYYIITDSKEKFEEIENAYKKFRENYILSLSGGKLIVRENPFFDKDIGIYPETEYDSIKEIATMESNLEGRILKSGNGSWLIELGKIRYLIYSKNPDFKKDN